MMSVWHSAPQYHQVPTGLFCRLGGLLVFFLDPEAVVLLGPVTVNTAGIHRVKRAFHANRTDIDMGHDHDDQRQRHKAVPQLVQLLFLHCRKVGRQA